jgi:ABC-type branched-subunit amino acid transport system substrate-binding protein
VAKTTRGLLLTWLFAGCQLATVTPPPPVEQGPSEPVVTPGPISDAEEREAAALYEQALASFEARRHPEALRITGDLVSRYPASQVSGAAVLLEARAEAALGAVERADAKAEQYIGLLEAGDPRAAEMRLFQADILAGQPMIQLDRLLRMDEGAPESDVQRALQTVRVLADSLALEDLEIVAEGAGRGGIAAAPLYTRLAIELLVSGEEERAAEYASAALEAGGASGAELTLAEGVLRGELPDSLRPRRAFAIATVLPHGGPPALARYAALISEGIEVAVATVLGDDYEVAVVVRDDEADSIKTVEIVSELEAEPVAGMIGFLQDGLLVAAAQAREQGVPIVSPTARNASPVGEGVYSLEGPDYQGAEAIARYSASRAHQRVAIVHPDTPIAAEEADAFAAVAPSLGVPIVGRFSYQAGAPAFQAQLEAAQNSLRAAEIAALGLTEDDTLDVEMLEPVGLFMPIPAEDVEFVAPQFASYGLDTLAIELMGTTGWTDPQALEAVDPRLVTGIVATAPVAAGPGSPGYERFREAYETHYQRSLVSSTPALGYDAALLLLEALRPGRVRPSDVRGALQQLTEIEGATGTFSIVDGRVQRRTQLVGIDRGQVVPIEPF